MPGEMETPQATPPDSQPQLSQCLMRKGSTFIFDHMFTHDNPGKLEEFYDVSKEQLGEGSFGSVFQAKCRNTSAVRAVKGIPLKAVKNMERFEREIAIQRQLDHPNVVRLFETFRDKEKVYLVMELCAGRELFDRIVDEGATGMEADRVARYVREMLSAICYLHSQQIAHRDVKPENFLLQNSLPDAQLKIIDFGLACTVTENAMLKTRLGTAYYVAPEVMSGRYNEMCDVWSVGVIAFILCCGSPPFQGDTDPEILKQVKTGKFEFKSPDWDTISEGAVTLITHMLTVNPELRPRAEELLRNPWLYHTSGAATPGPINSDLISRLGTFCAHGKLKKIALTVVAQQLPDEDIESLRSTFRALDRNGDGTLSAQEIRDGLVRQGMSVPKRLEDILKMVDSNHSGSIDYCEFIAATIDKKLYRKREVCWRAFCTFDLDGDGKITRDELAKVLGGSNVKDVLGFSKIDKMIEEFDKDGDGCIDFEEFLQMMQSESLLPSRKRTREESVDTDTLD